MPAWTSIETTSVGVPWYWLGHVLIDGAHGVGLVFYFSGFCLAYPTLVRVRRDGIGAFDVARFAAHRIVRILPPYWLSFLVFALLGALAYFDSHHRGSFAFPAAGPIAPIE